MFRKKISILVTFLVCCASANATQEDYRSGEIRLEHIMLNQDTGMNMKKHVNPDPAEALNLLNDLCYRELIKAFPCKTTVGPIYIEEMLKMPFRKKDKQTLLAKQNFIRALVDNPGLKHRFDQLLAEAQRYEQDIVIFMSDVFKTERCPELAQLDLLRKEESFQYPLKRWVNVDNTGRAISTPLSLFGTYVQAYAGKLALKDSYVHACAALQAKSKEELFAKLVGTVGQFGLGSYTTICAAFGIYNVYRDYINAAEKRLRMHGLNKLIHVANELENLCKEHSITCQFKVSDMRDEKGLEIINDLQHSRYTQESLSSKFFDVPSVHTLAYAIYTNDKQLAPILACIAEMDAYNAFATSIIDSYDKNNKFCFVNFIESDHSIINARSFWNLLVKNPVANTLCEQRHVLLTGPNAGGKSTTIRALLQNILLGQCFGIAAAESFDFTMFDVVHSYLSITDNILNGESRFKAEILRAMSIFKKIESLKPDQKYFFALDELFTGTSVEQGEKCAYAFINRVAKSQHVQCIYATHFEKLKQMGNAGGNVVNYKVDSPSKNADGSLVYPFTISPGASMVNIALDMAQQAGLFDEAMNVDEFIATHA